MEKDLLHEIDELKERNLLYEEILNKVLQGIFITDREENVVWFNDTVQLMDGVKREDAIGKRQEVAWEYLDLPNVMSKTIRTGQQSEEQLITYTDKKKNNKVSVFSQSFPFYYKDKFEYVYSIAYYINYSEKQLNKISEYRRKFLSGNARVINNTKYTFYDVIGESSEMKELIAKARKLALNKTPVMICGETGTGKEIFAQGIHNASLQNKGKFVAINCAAIPDNLQETILFGSVKGAFTGALDKPGLLEEATDGTLFLDELNSMSLALQSKFLRVIQEKQACRIGCNQYYPVNCRIISATNQDPRQLIKDATLRSDLFFRLAVLILDLPPLSKRENDVIALAHHFIQTYNRNFNLQIKTIDGDVLQLFLAYNWPGNVRELDNVIEYAMNFISSGRTNLALNDLPGYIRDFENNRRSTKTSDTEQDKTLRERLDHAEKEIVEEALRETGWNISRAARNLGIYREALYYRIKKFDLHK